MIKKRLTVEELADCLYDAIYDLIDTKFPLAMYVTPDCEKCGRQQKRCLPDQINSCRNALLFNHHVEDSNEPYVEILKYMVYMINSDEDVLKYYDTSE